MNYGTTDGVLQPLDETLLPDPRFKFFAIELDGDARPMELADPHDRLILSNLDFGVPEAVRREFETAKDLMLYSWFVFEFHMTAELHAYASLELALRTRFPEAKVKRKRGGKEVMVPLTLAPLLQIAMKEGLIVAETLPAWKRVKAASDWREKRIGMQAGTQQTPTVWLQRVIDNIRNFRNNLAHGNPRLYLEVSLGQLELCADLINSLFSLPVS
jgi:hypothetical protein